jgi:hypothetical protein
MKGASFADAGYSGVKPLDNVSTATSWIVTGIRKDFKVKVTTFG